MKIYAPVKDFNGLRGNVRFVNGVGETDDPQLIKWFETHGYKVPIQDSPVVESVEDIKNADQLNEIEEVEMMGYAEKTPELEDMTPNELREFAKANGKGHLIKSIRNKDKLIEIIRSKE